MKKRQLHIKRILTVLMLGVFAIALTPWGLFHHHEGMVTITAEENCSHKLHVKTQQDTCVICAVHFEKNYTAYVASYLICLSSKPIAKINPSVGSSFTALISTSLRGPPLSV